MALQGSDDIARGAALILGGMMLLGITDNFVRLISDDAGLWQFHLMRSAMALPLLAGAALFFGVSLRPKRPGAVAARSLAQTAAMLLYFGALPMMPVSQVAAALFSAPLWVLLFSAAFFRRRIGPRTAGAAALGFAGVLVMLRPTPDTLSGLTLMPLAAGALYGFSNLLTREWCAQETPATLVGGFFAGLGIAAGIALAILAVVTPPANWRAAAPFLTDGWRDVTVSLVVWVFVQAAGSLVAVAMIARGYQSGPTASLAVFEYSFILTISFWAWMLWGETLAPVDFLGIAMIVGSGIIVATTPMTIPPRVAR